MKNLDFRKVERRKHRQESAKRRMQAILTVMPLLLVFGYLQSYIFCIEQTEEMEAQIREIRNYLENEEVLSLEGEVEKLLENRKQLEEYKSETEELEIAANERAVMTADILKRVLSVMDGRVEMVWEDDEPVHYEEGVLAFTARTKVPSEASAYIERLRKEDCFENVEYNGFERRFPTENGEPVYQFNVSCRLALPEKKEVMRDAKTFRT